MTERNLARRLLEKHPDMYPSETAKVIRAFKEALVMAAARQEPLRIENTFTVSFVLSRPRVVIAKKPAIPQIVRSKQRRRAGK